MATCLNLFPSIVLYIFLQTTAAAENPCYIQFKKATCKDRHLNDIPQDLDPDILALDADSNNITALRNNSFLRYPKIRQLCLSKNNISTIESGAFKPLTKLWKLDLAINRFIPLLDASVLKYSAVSDLLLYGSNIQTFQSDVFSWLSSTVHAINLYLDRNQIDKVFWTDCPDLVFGIFDLSYNKLQRISEDNFVISCPIKELMLLGNPILVITPGAVSPLKAIHLGIGACELPPQLLRPLFKGVKQSSIRELELHSAGIQEISPALFNLLEGKQLRKLDLSSNKINLFPVKVFSNLMVDKLVLDNNYIATVEPSQFNGMINLKELSLNNNQISEINGDNDTWNLTITSLSLTDNSITRLRQETLHGMHALVVLDLSNNGKMFIENRTFAGLYNLEQLVLSGTEIDRRYPLDLPVPSLERLVLDNSRFPTGLIAPGQLGKNSPHLQYINLESTGTTVGDLWDDRRQVSSFEGLHELTTIYLNHNRYVSIRSANLFQHLSNLTRLGMAHCYIDGIYPGVFKDLNNLVSLDLRDNYLKVLYDDAFIGLDQLVDLYLGQNRIHYIGDNLFQPTTSLKILDMSDNRLVSLNLSSFQPLFSTLKSIDISLNPIICNCELQWMAKWVKQSLQLDYGEQTICAASPDTLAPFRGNQLSTFDPSKECSLNVILISSLTLVGTSFVLILALVYYHRYWFRYKLFLLRLCVFGYKEAIDGDERDHFHYDLCVIFHDNDEPWVNQHLRPALEERLPDFDRISCGDDDLRLGMHYLDAVNYAVEYSFKTIFVINKDAVQDHWFMLKFRTALDHVNDVGVEKMVLVFMDDIPDDELPFLMRLFLSDHRPYLVWPDGDRGQAFFWAELVKDLTVNVKCNHLVPP